MPDFDNLLGDIEFRFEIEHIFAEALYSDPAGGMELRRFGFIQQMRSNQIGLFSDPDTVAAVQNGPQGLRNLLLNAGWGVNRHDRFNFPDNFQAGKNTFLRRRIDQIIDSMEDISDEARRFAAARFDIPSASTALRTKA